MLRFIVLTFFIVRFGTTLDYVLVNTCNSYGCHDKLILTYTESDARALKPYVICPVYIKRVKTYRYNYRERYDLQMYAINEGCEPL